MNSTLGSSGGRDFKRMMLSVGLRTEYGVLYIASTKLEQLVHIASKKAIALGCLE